MKKDSNLAIAVEDFGNKLECLSIFVDLGTNAVSWRGRRVLVPADAPKAKCVSILKHFVRGAEAWAERNHPGELFEQTTIMGAIKPPVGKEIIITAIEAE